MVTSKVSADNNYPEHIFNISHLVTLPQYMQLVL